MTSAYPSTPPPNRRIASSRRIACHLDVSVRRQPGRTSAMSTPEPSAGSPDPHVDADHDEDPDDAHTVAVIGGGSAAEALIRELAGSEHRVVLFEPSLLGGECPFVACMPSKALLHDAGAGTPWASAVERRHEVVDGMDDSEHVREARDLGVTLVRQRAWLRDAHHVATDDGRTFRVDHVVIATGAEPVVPPVAGLEPSHERIWTSEDALTTTELPERLTILGGGVIGSELAQLFNGFGSRVTVLDAEPRPLDQLHPRVGDLVNAHLAARGVDVRSPVQVTEVRCRPDGVDVVVDDGHSVVSADRLIVATGRRPRRSGLGLECLGADPDELTVDATGRVEGPGSVWMIGDVAGLAQYTHLANHHAAVVADHLTGGGGRRFDEVAVPACVFVDPPVMMVGPSRAALEGDDDVAWALVDLDIPRRTTDALADGFLAVAARRSTGRVIAAHGVGARFDELVHALVVAIDGEVPLDVLRRSIRPFPTVGEILDVAFDELDRQIRSG
jgi:pyruvate/2-oxoglutarate dehydrogenase complex dihydrolipoamide dehydrogenase (E3) component